MMTLAQRIEREMVALLADENPLAFKLTLSGISSHFGVSPMPVRRAVDELIGQGLLRKGANGRLEPVAEAIAALEHVDVEVDAEVGQDPVGDRITDEVILRSLTREAHYLREAATAEQFGVGRTVVRRVFGRLSGQGMLRHVPRCGWRVRPYREKDMLDYLDVRETLEIKAMRIARDRLDPAVLEDFRSRNDPGGRGRPVLLDNRLHAYWIQQSGNRYIQEFFEQHGDFYSALFDYAALEPSANREMARQHIEILDALLAGDLPTARRALARHIRSQQPNLVKLIDQLTRQTDTRKN